MKVNKKICKGQNKAINFKGCNTLVYRYRYGLCKTCFNTFLATTKEGLDIINKSVIKGRKNLSKQRKKENKQRFNEIKETLRNKSYYEKKLQTEINAIVRSIDKNHNCISSNRPLNKKFDAGHFYSVGGNASLRFNLNNIFAQSVTDNQYKGGCPLEFLEGLKTNFSDEYANYVLSLKKRYKLIKLSKEDLKECITKAKEYFKHVQEYKIKNNKEKLSLKERLELRKKGNQYIGIYT